MLTHLTIRNFKRFESVEIELGSPVVFFGPNNSGKTSAMQALALWDIGLRRWNGIAEDEAWQCGLEFDYANEESFYCRPLRLSEDRNPKRMPVPEAAGHVRIAFLPPMSGLAATETRLDHGAVNVRVGEGRTAEVLRNLCYGVYEEGTRWSDLVERIRGLFGAELTPPRYIAERGEIAMSYREHGITLDLSCAGRGLQQTLLLLAYMYANPGAVLLLDEPDAHLEILRQRQTYQLLTETAEATRSQIIAASHSEVLLNEAAGKDLVVAFVGKPHRLDNRGSQVLKSLNEFGFEHYYQAEQTGWVLYLEGSTDLSMLRAFAKRLDHTSALRALERPFVHYVGNRPSAAAHHFHALREALPELRAAGLFDRLEKELPGGDAVEWLMWERREFENYLATRRTLERYSAMSATDATPGPLFAESEQTRRGAAMLRSIKSVEAAMKTLGKGSPWDPGVKVSDDFLDPLFADYFARLGLPNEMPKKSFHVLARYVPRDEIDPEVEGKLDSIARVAEAAKGRV